ncbi:MAG: PilW family protein [Sideroxydans sp.]|jgi:type IV pilus assembly protein PilW
MTPKAHHILKRHSGFTLVEIMVGLAIGMLATLIILQVISMFEAQKRVTTGAADAQTNGSIALFNIVRELNLAGYPLMPIADSPLECTTVTFGTTGITSITPVTLTDGASGASDAITLRYGNSAMGGIPSTIEVMGSPNPNDATVGNNFGCAIGNIALISNGATCALTAITDISPASTVPATITLTETTNATSGANLACLGNWSEVDFAVNNNNLEREGTPIVAGIVSIQAQYGLSASTNSNQVTQWVEPSTINIANIADRNRIKAIRIAIVARNGKMEAGNVTTALNAWTGSVSSPAPTIDLSTDADWQRYRYRVFETIVPLRNMIWARDTL